MSGSSLPLAMTPQGAIPTPPATLRSNLVAAILAAVPGFTDNLPASMVEDLVSTGTFALVQCNQFFVDLVNSITPLTANPWLLYQLGQCFGVPVGAAVNTSVDVVFSGTPGLPIRAGFLVGDGVHQYAVQDSTAVAASGVSPSVTAVAVQTGSWAVPPGSVTQVLSSFTPSATLTVTNPVSGVPAQSAPTEEQYRSDVFLGCQSTGVGMITAIRNALYAVSGVGPNLVSVQQVGGQLEIIVGGGDEYLCAAAVFQNAGDISALTGSVLGISNVTQANPGVVTTNKPHGFSSGASATITGVVGMTQLNGNTYTVTVIDDITFSIGTNTTSFTAYVDGGEITPNARNIMVSIPDGPDTYTIPLVRPLQQVVTMSISWNTNDPNFVSGDTVAQLVQPAIVSYINGIQVGKPINELQLTSVFQTAVSSVLDPQFLSHLSFSVTINGRPVSVTAGTNTVPSGPEDYFFTEVTDITVVQG